MWSVQLRSEFWIYLTLCLCLHVHVCTPVRVLFIHLWRLEVTIRCHSSSSGTIYLDFKTQLTQLPQEASNSSSACAPPMLAHQLAWPCAGLVQAATAAHECKGSIMSRKYCFPLVFFSFLPLALFPLSSLAIVPEPHGDRMWNRFSVDDHPTDNYLYTLISCESLH